MDLTHYEVLGVDTDAELAAIRVAYRRRARATHPDSGGDATEFAAVATAWWVLSSPDRRAAYDAGQAAADDAGWGEDLGWDATVPPPRTAPAPVEDPAPAETPEPTPDADPRPGGGTGGPGEPASGADDPPEAPATPPRLPIHPFTSPPRVLPGAGPAANGSPPSAARRRAIMIALGAVLLAAAAIVVDGLRAGDLTSTIPIGLAVYSVLLGVALRVRETTREGVRGAGTVTAAMLWGMVTAFAGITAIYLVDLVTPARLLVMGVPLAVSVRVAVGAEKAIRRRRRDAETERLQEIEHRLAERWNQLLDIREKHGAAHVVAIERLGRPVWSLVTDDDGTQLFWAPQSSPVAWARMLRRAGADVARVPRHDAVREPSRREGETAARP